MMKYPRTNYEMTEANLETLLAACKPTTAIMVGSYQPMSPQEKANRAWRALGEKMGFDHETVKPIEGKGMRFFSAVPSETESQEKERLQLEAKEKRLAEIKQLENEIVERTDKLNRLKTEEE